MNRLIAIFSLFVGLVLASRTHATLIDRGNGLIYDTVLNVTWTQDANLCATLNNCPVLSRPGFPLGVMSWDNAKIWADNLVYQGFSDWRLPSVDVNGDGTVVHCSTNVDCPDNEYGHMYYQNLNAMNFQNKTGTQIGDGGVTFQHIGGPWSGTARDANFAWAFDFSGFIDGGTVAASTFDENVPLFAWAVRNGDVRLVPELGSAILLGLGLLPLLVFVSRQRSV